MPQHTARISHVCHAETPRLNLRRSRRAHAELAGQIETLDVSPPCVQVVDHELHHEILGPFLLIGSLQDKPARARSKDGNVRIENLVKADRFVEPFGEFEILRGQERAGQLAAIGNSSHLRSSYVEGS
jgi:hypothetical protein